MQIVYVIISGRKLLCLSSFMDIAGGDCIEMDGFVWHFLTNESKRNVHRGQADQPSIQARQTFSLRIDCSLFVFVVVLLSCSHGVIIVMWSMDFNISMNYSLGFFEIQNTLFEWIAVPLCVFHSDECYGNTPLLWF